MAFTPGLRFLPASSLSFSSDLVRGVHARASFERQSRETRETDLDCLFYKAKTIVITNGCTTGHRAIEQRFSRKKEKTKKQIGAQRMILSDLQRWLSFS